MLLFLLMGAVSAFAQRTVSGTVADGKNGEPISGASIIVKGTTVGVFSGNDGKFRLEVPQGGSVLRVSFFGYQTVELPVTGDVMNIVLDEDALNLDEVIITGYGSQIKRELTGNIAKVDGKAIENTPVVSVEQTLQGRAAGVFIESTNGKTGGAIKMRIRGASSINASNQPLFVVDGVPITTASQNTGGAPLNPLNDINFNDIASIEILKDASAAAIYGSRAANGVVLITTKQGRTGSTQVNFNLSAGVSNPTGYREFLNTEEFISMFQRAARGAALYEFRNGEWDTEQEALDWWDGFVTRRFNRYDGHLPWNDPAQRANTDWQDEAFRTGNMRNADVSVAGGAEKTRFYISGGYSRQEGILVGNGFERMNGRLNLDHTPTKWLDLGLSMALSRTAYDQVADDNGFNTPLQLIALSPITPTRDPDGKLYDVPVTTYYNGLIELEETVRNFTAYRNLTNGYAVLKLLPGLTVRGDLGIDLYTGNDDQFSGREALAGQGIGGFGRSTYSQVLNYRSSAFINYNRVLADAHSVDLTGGMEFQKSTSRFTRTEGEQFPIDDLKTLASAARITLGTSTLTEFSFLSYFARLNYNYNRKYLLSLSARTDGSSRFGTNNRFGFFPAASAGWVISEESFLQNSEALSFLKLRASYGFTGNAEIGNFPSLGLYGSASYAGLAGLAPTQIPNPDLRWERTAQVDIGLDFGLFNDRITGEIDYYNKRTTDLLLEVPVPATTGFTTQFRNIGEVSNRGFEFVLNPRILTGDFSWSMNLNMAINRNEVVSLAEGQDIIDVNGERYPNVVKVGEPIGVFWGAEYAGVDPQTGDALWFKNTKDDDGNVIDETSTTNDFNEAEFVVIGSPVPDVIYGVTNNLSFMGLELSFTFQGVQGNEIHNAGGLFMSCNACWFDNQTRDQLEYWDQPGDVTDVPEPRLGYSNGDNSRSSRYISSGSYLRLRNASLSYTLPKSITDRLSMRTLRVFVTGQNLLTFTKYEGWDPEVTTDFLAGNVNQGLDFYSAPQPRTLVGGINIGF
ncbi:MAG: TonB-dependent receptor [Bacteroidia bacterium]|nr:TonB-dependent receptor [Bacteroidia bacterium]